MGLDTSRAFVPVRIVVLVVSDSRTLDTDTSGASLAALVEEAGHTLVGRHLVRDDQAAIEGRLRAYVDDPGVDVVLSTGGTGITARDVTPEAVRAVLTKELPGFGELFRYVSLRSVGTSTIQSRALGGVARTTLIFALPGSRGAVRDAWSEILVHQLDSRHRPCNFVDLLPRLDEGAPA